MYFRFFLTNGHTCIPDKEAEAAMSDDLTAWQIQKTPLGSLYTLRTDHNHSVEVMDRMIRMQTETIKRNVYASEFFELNLYGECYLKPFEGMEALVTPALLRFERNGIVLSKLQVPDIPQQNTGRSKKKR